MKTTYNYVFRALRGCSFYEAAEFLPLTLRNGELSTSRKDIGFRLVIRKKT